MEPIGDTASERARRKARLEALKKEQQEGGAGKRSTAAVSTSVIEPVLPADDSSRPSVAEVKASLEGAQKGKPGALTTGKNTKATEGTRPGGPSTPDLTKKGKGKSEKGLGKGGPNLSIEALRNSYPAIRAATDFERLAFKICETAAKSEKIYHSDTDRALAECCRNHWRELSLRPGVPGTTPAKDPPKAKEKKSEAKEVTDQKGSEEESSKKEKAAENEKKSRMLDIFKNSAPVPLHLFEATLEKNQQLPDQEKQKLLRQTVKASVDYLESKNSTVTLKKLYTGADNIAEDKAAIQKALNFVHPDSTKENRKGYFPDGLNPFGTKADVNRTLREENIVAELICSNAEGMLDVVQQTFGTDIQVQRLSSRLKNAYALLTEALVQKKKDKSKPKDVQAVATQLFQQGLALNKLMRTCFAQHNPNYLESLKKRFPDNTGIADLDQDTKPSAYYPDSGFVDRIQNGRVDPVTLWLLQPAGDEESFVTYLVAPWNGEAPDFLQRVKEGEKPNPVMNNLDGLCEILVEGLKDHLEDIKAKKTAG
jgi:hypothetical protein